MHLRDNIQLYYDETKFVPSKFKYIDYNFTNYYDKEKFYKRLFHTKLFYSFISYLKYKVQNLNIEDFIENEKFKDLCIYDILDNKQYINEEVINFFIKDIEDFKCLFIDIPNNINELYNNRYKILLS